MRELPRDCASLLVARNIRRLRLRHGWSRRALAARARVSPSYVARLDDYADMVTPIVNLSVDMAEQFAEALGVTFTELATAEEVERDTGAPEANCVDDRCEICGEYESECTCGEDDRG